MVLMAAVGAVVLAMISWAALREAQRLPGSFPTARSGNAPQPSAARRPVVAHRPAAPEPHTASWHVSVAHDATVADADTDEALAAAAALWHVLVDDAPR